MFSRRNLPLCEWEPGIDAKDAEDSTQWYLMVLDPFYSRRNIPFCNDLSMNINDVDDSVDLTSHYAAAYPFPTQFAYKGTA